MKTCPPSRRQWLFDSYDFSVIVHRMQKFYEYLKTCFIADIDFFHIRAMNSLSLKYSRFFLTIYTKTRCIRIVVNFRSKNNSGLKFFVCVFYFLTKSALKNRNGFELNFMEGMSVHLKRQSVRKSV